MVNRKLIIITLVFENPLITPLEKEILQEILEFLSTYYPNLSFHLCFNNRRELTSDEGKRVLQEVHSNYLRERNTIETILVLMAKETT